MNITHALDFPSGKLWVAEQLDIVASRYLNRNARIIAQGVRQTIAGSQEPNLEDAMRPVPPVQEKLVTQNMQISPGSSTTFQISDTAEIDCDALIDLNQRIDQ